jgi:hypothetical protein
MKDAVPSSSPLPSASPPDEKISTVAEVLTPYFEERILTVKIATPEGRGKEVPLSGHDVHCLRIWRMYSKFCLSFSATTSPHAESFACVTLFYYISNTILMIITHLAV